MSRAALQSGVRAAINYIVNPPAENADYLTFVSEAEETSSMQTRPHEVWINNARPLSASLDREGFQLVSHRSSITDFAVLELDPQANTQYTNELSQMLAAVTGAERVLILFGAKQRFSEKIPIDKTSSLVNARPARYPHADNTDASSIEQIKMFAAYAGGIDLKAYSRHALYNLWRCVSPAPQDCPLAVCDARSIVAADEIPVTAITPNRTHGEVRHITTGYLHNPEHRWCYYPDLAIDEVIVFKTHDTDPDRPRRVAHTAFDDPSCPAAAPPRASVEARALALFR